MGVPVLGLGGDQEALIVYGSLGQFAGHLLAIGVLARRRGGLRSLGFDIEPSDVVFIFWGIGLQIALPLLFAPLAQFFGDGPTGQAVTDELMRLETTPYRLLMAGIVAVLAPVAEELMFRGILLQATLHRGALRASFLTAGVFSAFHLVGLSGDFLAGLILLLPTFLIMGVVLARLTIKRGRLGPAIFVHSGFNLLALSLLLFPQDLLQRFGS